MVGTAEMGGMVNPILRNKFWMPFRKEKKKKGSWSFQLSSHWRLGHCTEKDLNDLGFLNAVFSWHLSFYLLFLQDINREVQYGRYLWSWTRKWSEAKQKDWVPPTAAFKRNRNQEIEWVIAALRRAEVKLRLWGISGKKREVGKDVLDLR